MDSHFEAKNKDWIESTAIDGPLDPAGHRTKNRQWIVQIDAPSGSDIVGPFADLRDSAF